MIISIKELRLRTIIGAHDWERDVKQDVVINVIAEVDGNPAAESDDLLDTVDYKMITKEIIELVETSEFYLIEKLAESILDIVMFDQRIVRASVEVDKPHALRFADSVSIETGRER